MQKLTPDILTLARKLNLKWIIGFSKLLDVVTTRLTFFQKQLNNNNNKSWSAKAFHFNVLFFFCKVSVLRYKQWMYSVSRASPFFYLLTSCVLVCRISYPKSLCEGLDNICCWFANRGKYFIYEKKTLFDCLTENTPNKRSKIKEQEPWGINKLSNRQCCKYLCLFGMQMFLEDYFPSLWRRWAMRNK